MAGRSLRSKQRAGGRSDNTNNGQEKNVNRAQRRVIRKGSHVFKKSFVTENQIAKVIVQAAYEIHITLGPDT